MPSKKFTSVYHKPNPNPRHLMVFLDGTWNDENGKENDGITTSIYRLFRAVQGTLDETDVPHVINGDGQMALYFRGVGNDDDNGMVGSYFEGAFGAGEKRIRDHAYLHILKHYRKGDKLSIFGFSRGAACARLLAASLAKHGLYKSAKVHFNRAENPNNGKTETVYKKYSDEETDKKATVEVSFLGIFDTVGAFGIPIDLGFSFQKVNLFKDMSIAPNVKQVVHCVAIDETREPFKPTLCNAAPHVDEVWFAGVHADIGGSYRHRELSAYPVTYMVNRLDEVYDQHPIKFEAKKLAELTQVSDEGPFNLHYHGDGVKMDFRRIHVQVDDKPSRRKPKVHSSVFRLMQHDKVFRAETTDSFATVQKVLYSPRGLGKFAGTNVAVD